jgi:NAD(P)-dependent dehydrogenase (short-subunit alcohol dehydrogenase family)
MKLEGKTILITGSVSGIGEAIARKCHGEGANILLHGLDASEGEAVLKRFDGRAAFHACDLIQPDSAEELVQKAVDTFGGIFAVVNNAAVFPRATIEHTDAELFDETMAVNARAPLLLCKAAADELAKSQGVIVNIGSINAYCGEANLLVYSMSKGALMTMTRSLGEYLQYTKGICSYQLNLGWVLSENERKRKIEEGLPVNWYELQPKEVSPHGKLLTPDQIATMAFPFVSGDMRPTSGSVIELEQFPVIGRNPTKQ